MRTEMSGEGASRRRSRRAAALLPGAVLTALALYAFVFPDATSTAVKPAQVAPALAAPPQWDQLEGSLAKMRDTFRGTVAYYVEDLQTGRSFGYNENLALPAASLIKLPLAVAVMEQELQGKVALDAEITLKASDKANGSGILRRYPSGTKLTVAGLLELMLQRSDNTATNILTDIVGLEEVNGSCRRQGLGATCMPRYIMDLEARDTRSIENYTSAADMARLLKALYYRKTLDGPACQRLLDILKGQKVRDRLPRYLPPGVVVANKTGLMNKICHDAGIIYGVNHDYVVAVLTSDFPSFRYAKDAIGKTGRMVYLYDRGEPLTPPAAARRRKVASARPAPASKYRR